MGFSIKEFIARKKRIKENAAEELVLETEDAKAARFASANPEEVSDEIVTLCEQLLDASYRIQDLRVEYETVSAYYGDIQKIEEMPEDMRRQLNEIALKIEFVEKNQEEFKQIKTKLSDDKYRIMTKYEDDIPDVMRQLMELETRDAAIKRDMKYLESEKITQDYLMEDALVRQYQLRSVSIATAILSGITFLVVLLLSWIYQFSMVIPGLTIFFIVTLAFVILFMRYREESYGIKLAQLKKNRAINLLNSVKLKYVNSASTLDYIYQKYNVRSLREMEYLWDQYNTLVQETKKFRQSIGDMRTYFDEMEKVLRQANLMDPYIWTQQVRALLDDREMVEVKHNINTRRQEIRAGISGNEEMKKACMAKMKTMVTKDPSMMETIHEILSMYNINF